MLINVKKLNKKQQKELEKKLINAVENETIIDFELLEKMEKLKKFYRITQQIEKMEKVENEINNTINIINMEV